MAGEARGGPGLVAGTACFTPRAAPLHAPLTKAGLPRCSLSYNRTGRAPGFRRPQSGSAPTGLTGRSRRQSEPAVAGRVGTVLLAPCPTLHFHPRDLPV